MLDLCSKPVINFSDIPSTICLQLDITLGSDMLNDNFNRKVIRIDMMVKNGTRQCLNAPFDLLGRP
jgi:hypothetical protein